jgi:mannose-6-phosphate isomerase-like protein (cupin superfamily)
MTQPLDLPRLLADHRQRSELWLEFFRMPSMSLGIYKLAKGGVDPQTPHDEDEVYYVLSGHGRIEIGGDDHVVEPGALIFVERKRPHRFYDIKADLELLVFFAPAEGSLAAKASDTEAR